MSVPQDRPNPAAVQRTSSLSSSFGTVLRQIPIRRLPGGRPVYRGKRNGGPMDRRLDRLK